MAQPDSVTPLSQLCYDIAYFLLPTLVFRNLEKLKSLCQQTPDAAGPACYFMACQARKVEPDRETARRFRWQSGVSAGRPYLALEYPSLETFQPGVESLEHLLDVEELVVLVPYWSVVFWEGEVEYYILGQSPLRGMTTLRRILPDGANCNLGPGPAPGLPELLAAIGERGQQA